MKTVQECLKELDIEDLITCYLALEPLQREIIGRMKKKDNKSAKELWLQYYDFIRDYIEYIRQVPIEPTDEPGVLFVYEAVETQYTDKCYHELCHISELKKDGVEAEGYSYHLSTHGKVAGFLVADTERTQENLLDLMTYVLYEASFYGYTKKEQEKQLKESIDSLNGIDIDEDADDDDNDEIESEDCEEDLGYDFVRLGYRKPESEQCSEEEKQLEKIYKEASHKYHTFLRNKALQEVVDLLN